MGEKLVKGLVVVAGVILFVFTLPFLVRETTMIYNWSSSGFVLCSIHTDIEGNIRFWGVDDLDFREPPYPESRDVILRIDDKPASIAVWAEVLESPHKPGKEVSLDFVHEGEEKSTVIKTRPVSPALIMVVAVMQILKVLIFLSFLILGFWAFRKKPDSTGIRALALYSFSVAAYMANTYMPMYPNMASFDIPHEYIMRWPLRLMSIMFSSFWLCLNMVFPRRIRLIQKAPGLVLLFCFAPQIIIAAVSFSPLNGWWLGMVLYAVIAIQVLAGLFLLRHHFITSQSKLERRQTKLVFWGSGISLVLFLVYLIDYYGIVHRILAFPLSNRLWVTNIIFFFLLASPLSFAYAFGRFRLLEVEGKLKRGTRYLVVTILLLFVYFGLLYAFGELLLQHIGITGRTPTLITALVLALGFAPAQRLINRWVERKLFPERQQLVNLTRDFLQRAYSLTNRESLWKSLTASLKQGMRVTEALPVLRTIDNGQYRLADREETPFLEGSSFISHLSQVNHPLMIDEAMVSERIELTGDERRWFSEHNVALVLPLHERARLGGFLGIGFKENGEEFDPEALQILTGFTSQIALVGENLRLFEDNLEKQRLEEQLQIARHVQEGFLPGEIPDSEGLEIAACSSFSLEVAGDYYDVLPIDDGRTMLAVGDVSGKGAGAAMIMANLQASLRALCGIGLELDNIVKRVNAIIYQNTEPEQYITFFISIYDPRSKSLTYVNAGHNYPILIRNGNRVEYLDRGGLILGTLTSATYSKETIRLESDDVLLLYTDGVSEAMNSEEEEFGEHRIVNHLLENSSLAVKDIMDKLMEDVRGFHGDSPHEDDLTLLLVRVR